MHPQKCALFPMGNVLIITSIYISDMPPEDHNKVNLLHTLQKFHTLDSDVITEEMSYPAERLWNEDILYTREMSYVVEMSYSWNLGNVKLRRNIIKKDNIR